MNCRLGKLIAKRRKYMQLTQEELAKLMHVSKSAVAKWETDGGIPDRDNIYKLAEILGVSVEDMYRIVARSGENEADLKINITTDVIGVLESYGYTVTPPEKSRNYSKKKKESEK